jgi:hypothetical protein
MSHKSEPMMILNWLRRARAYRHVELVDVSSGFFTSANTSFFLKAGAHIKISGGSVHLGFPLPGIQAPFASFPECVLSMGDGALLSVEGDVFIAPGATIRIGDGAELVFRGANHFAHNLLICCNGRMEFKRGASVSWNAASLEKLGTIISTKCFNNWL